MSTNTNPNAPAADDHAPMGPPSAETIRRGYEVDSYDTKSVLSVPLLVVLFFVLAFGTVTVIFRFIAPTKADPKAHPAASARNKEPLNDRLKRIERGKEVDQPRLEPLKLRSGEARAISRPELPVADGNSPELHPEDLIPTKERFPALYNTTPDKKKYGLDRTMSLNDDALQLLFPVQKGGTHPAESLHVPTASNAGRGAEGATVILPGTPAVPPPAPTPAPDPKKGGKQ